MARWRLIKSIPDFVDCPSSIIVWNNCNGPMEWRVEPEDIYKFRDGTSGWLLWCEMPRPSKADEERAMKHPRICDQCGEHIGHCECHVTPA